MFLLRSAFWLTVAFVVLAPKGTDLGAATAKAVAAGEEVVAAQVLALPCDTLVCEGGKAVVAVALEPNTPSLDTPMQDSSSVLVPLPRPRPDRMG